MPTSFYTTKDNEINSAADWRFDLAAIETEKKIVYGPDGKLYFEDEVPVDAEAERQRRISEIKAELDRLDLASIRPLRAIDNGDDNPDDHEKLIELERRANTLRAELRSLAND